MNYDKNPTNRLLVFVHIQQTLAPENR